MRVRRLLLAVAVLISGALGTSTPASSQTTSGTACEAYCGAIVAGCYVFVGIVVRNVCERMYEGCLDGCYAALLDRSEDEKGSSGGGGF